MSASAPGTPTSPMITSPPAWSARNSARVRSLSDFNIEALTTTESPLDDLRHHRKIKSSGWSGRVLTAFRPDPVVDPDFPRFLENLKELGRIADCDVSTYDGYLAALARRRAYFKSIGCARRTTAIEARAPRTCKKAKRPRSTAASAGVAPRPPTPSFSGAQMLTEMGGDEPRGWARHADPSGIGARPQSCGSPRPSAGTRAAISLPD